jgi:glutamyl-tRNA reductase
MIEKDPAASVLPLATALHQPPAVGLVITAISSDETILSRDHAAAIRDQLPADERLLLLDLAMPSNIDAAAGDIEGVTLHGIEHMRKEAEDNRQLRLAELDRCEALVEHQLEILRRHLLDRALGPVARSIHQSFSEMADRAVQHSLSRDLAHLGEDDRRAVESLTSGLVKRLVQVPIKGLKGAAWNHSSAVISNFIKALEDINGRTDNGDAAN